MRHMQEQAVGYSGMALGFFLHIAVMFAAISPFQ